MNVSAAGVCILLWLLAAAISSRAAPVTALAFSPDGAALVSNGSRKLEIRSPVDAQVQAQVVCDLPKITALAFHPRGRLLAVGGGTPGVGGELVLLHWPDRQVIERRSVHQDLVTSVAFSPNGALLAIASADQQAQLFPLTEQGSVSTNSLTLSGHSGPVLALAFSLDNELVVTGGVDRSLRVWSARTGEFVRSLGAHTEAVHALAFRPRADMAAPQTIGVCASGSADRTVRIWQPTTGRMVRIVRQHEGSIFALTYSPDGRRLFSAGKEGRIRQLDVESDAILHEWSLGADWIYALACSPDGTRLASGDFSGQVRISTLEP